MLIDHSREKLINLILYFVKNTKICHKTKLFKLLYYADFFHFKETGRSISGLKYYAWEMGPVPRDLFNEIKNPKQDLSEYFKFIENDEGYLKIVSKKPIDLKHFSKREKRIIKNIAFIFKDALAKEIVEISHLPNQPWSKTIKSKGKLMEIDYELAFDDSNESITLQEYKQKEADFKEIIEALS